VQYLSPQRQAAFFSSIAYYINYLKMNANIHLRMIDFKSHRPETKA